MDFMGLGRHVGHQSVFAQSDVLVYSYFIKNCIQIILVTEANRIDACNFYKSVGYCSNTHKGFKKKLKCR
ncbi:MAG: acetyltransferase [Firmicutes bacterium]|nr:acetyltransferase [Bacillota bacterium]